MIDILKKQYVHLVAILVFAFLASVYFLPQFQGKVIPQGDMISYQGMSHELKEHKKATGEDALWTNSMFGGMPAYQIHTPQSNNMLKWPKRFLGLNIGRPTGIFVMGMICFYILMISLKVSPWLAIIASIAFGFSTNNLILYEAGHVTKLSTIMISPILIAGAMLVFKKKYWIGGILFSLGFGINLMSNHPQMTYYLGLVMAIFVLIQLVTILKNKDYQHLFKSGAILSIGLLIAFFSCASKLWTTYEYSKDTMRGAPILSTNAEKVQSSSETEGLEWNYAMAWSNGALDLISSYIPLAVGGGSRETLSKDSATGKFLKKRGMNVNKGIPLPTYWGSLPFTSGPVYFGAVIFFLFVFASFYVESPVKWWLVVAVGLTFILSMGKNFEFFNRFLFDYLPFYNKFRTPNSVLSITAILIPLLAFIGLDKFFKDDGSSKKAQKALYISAGLTLGLSIILALLGPSMFSFSAAGDSRLVDMGLDLNTIEADRASMLRSSALLSSLYIALVAGLMYFYQKSKIGFTVAVVGIALISSIDLLAAAKRYVNNASFVTEREYDKSFEKRPADTQILQDTDPHYRVHDVTIDPFNSSSSSYFHKTIGGYHAAKLQRIQDMYDRHISKGNQKVLNMMNAKYFIVPDESGKAFAQRNPAALGNVWFVNSIKLVNNANEEIDALNDFDPAGEAIVHQEFANYVKGLNLQKSGVITLTEYQPDYLKYESNTETNQFAVFSEVWYGPDKGWIAKIDGVETDFIRVNYILRGMKVPSGKHVIEFEFKPQSYYTGEALSLIFSSLILLAFFAYIFYTFYKPQKGIV